MSQAELIPPVQETQTDVTSIPANRMDLRSDVFSMLLPFFPEDAGLKHFETEIDGYSLTMYSEAPDGQGSIATSADRKLLNLLGGAIARNIRAGSPPTRKVSIDTRTLVETLSGDAVTGGSDYQRIVDRLKRLMSTVIETKMPLGDGIARHRRFRWIDAYEHDDKTTAGGRKLLGLRITLSEDAFNWITRALGYDIPHERFHALTSARSSSWRIYEICLAYLLANGGQSTRMAISDIKARVPISSELKLFKSRTLRSAFETIAGSPEMSEHIALHLERRRDSGFERVTFSTRVPLQDLYVAIHRGAGALPNLAAIIPKDAFDDAIQVPSNAPQPFQSRRSMPGGPSM